MALLALATPERLTSSIRACLQRGQRFISTLVYWEVMIKVMKGSSLDVGDPRQWWADALDVLKALQIPLRPEHISAIYHLPPIHKDPFDRAMIGQAIVEDLTLLTMDSTILQYAHEGFRVLQ